MAEPDHTPDASRRHERLQSDIVGWLGSVRPDGRPHVAPVWFLWSGDSLLILTQPDSVKARNIETNPAVTFALDGTEGGREPIFLEGLAASTWLADDDPEIDAYFAKYRALLDAMHWQERDVRRDYSRVLRINDIGFFAF